MNKAVFFDRDGTLNQMIVNEAHGHIDSPYCIEDLIIKDGAKQLINTVIKFDYFPIVISNQPGIEKQTLKAEQLDKITNAMCTKLNIPKNQVYYCLHSSENNCNCRKPKTGLLQKAAMNHNIDLKKSLIIGDGWNDIVAGKNAGVYKTILIGRKDRTELINLLVEKNAMPDYFAKDLYEVLNIFKRIAR